MILSWRMVALTSLSFGVFALLSLPLQALPEDREQPVRVESRQMQWNNQAQKARYSGDVIATQGELRIESEVMTLERNPQGELSRALAEASSSDQLAYFRDLPSLDQAQIEGWAETIDYHPAEDRLILTGQARLIQGEDLIQGHQLIYHLTSQDIEAQQADTPDAPRVEMIFTPQPSGARQ